MKENEGLILKILIGVIAAFSVIILFSGIFYIRSMRKTITKLEKEQKEQVEKRISVQNIPSVQTSQPQQTETVKTETEQSAAATETKTTQPAASLKKGSIFITKSTSGPVNVRAEGSMNSEIIDNLSDNVILKFVSSKGNWYYVSYNIRGYNEYGYIHKSQLAR